MLDIENRMKRDYLRHNKNCEYCKALGAINTATVVIPRQIGEQKYFVALCEEHLKRLIEIEGTSWESEG